MIEIVDCEEFGEILVPLSMLMHDGELRLDERIMSKGYLTVGIKSGQITLRATKFVGLIPLTPDLAVRVTPRATISNLSYMLVRSGIIPSVIAGYSRGYLPRFTSAENVEQIYGRSLVDGVKLIAKRGLIKEYIQPPNPPAWRGRLMVSDTIRLHASKGVKYRHEFIFKTLSPSVIENIALKAALAQVQVWYRHNKPRNPIGGEIAALLRDFWPVADWQGSVSDLVADLARRIHNTAPQRSHYRDPMWASLLILQQKLPETDFDGLARLDSLIINVSDVFEAFVRRELADRLGSQGFSVEDGNHAPGPLFVDGSLYTVHPDIIIKRDGDVVGILDAKYKQDPKEDDRYEVISFMDAMGASIGGFVCPAVEGHSSRYLGETASGKSMCSLRYDLAALDFNVESDRFADNVLRMIAGRRDFR